MAKKTGTETGKWPDGDPSFERWKARCIKELIPKIEGSAIFVSITPRDRFKTDVKFAVELGFAIMYDKPIIAVIPPGTKVPEKLVKVADRIVELDVNLEDGRRRLTEVLAEIVRERGGDSEAG